MRRDKLPPTLSTPYVESLDGSTDHDNRRGQVTTYEWVRRGWGQGAQPNQKKRFFNFEKNGFEILHVQYNKNTRGVR